MERRSFEKLITNLFYAQARSSHSSRYGCDNDLDTHLLHISGSASILI